MMSSLQKVGQAVLALVLVLVMVSVGTSAPLALAQTSCGNAVDLMLVLDGSASIEASDFATMQSFSKSIVSTFNLSDQGAHIGIVQFSSFAQTEIGLSGDANAVNGAIDSMTQLAGGTDISEGLNLGQKQLERSSRRASRIMILLTDGQSLAAPAIAVATKAKKAGTVIVSIGVGSAVDFDLLNAIASDPDSRFVYSVGNFSGLLSVLPQVTQTACSVRAKPLHSSEGPPAFVTVVQRSDPNTAARRDGIVTYTIVAMNRGKGSSKDTVVTMPFDPAEAAVIDATFSRKGPWVSKLITNTLEFNTGPLASGGDTVTATIRLATLPNVVDGTSLAERLTYRWDDDRSGGDGHSNLPILTAAGSDNNQQFYTLNVAPAVGAAGSTHRFTTGIFAPDEPITFWYNAPDGTVEPLNNLMANTDGAMDAVFSTKNLKPGTYSMVARGNWTGFTAVGMFQVQ